MKIIVPVSRTDVHMLPIFTDVLLHHGNLHNHSIILFPTEPCTAEADTAANRLRQICPSVSVQPLPDFQGGWPKAPNAHWAHALRHLRSTGNTEPWLWLEVDTVPMVSNWAEQMQREYNACGAPLLGHVRQTVYRNEDGSVFHEDGDEMLLGVAMYSPGFGEGEVDPLIRDLLRGPFEAPDEPFDVYLRWAMRRVGWAHTGLVTHCWKSSDWLREGDDLVYTNDAGIEVLRGFLNFQRNGPALIHGCKDESLYRIAMGQSPQQVEKMDLYVPPVDGLVELEPPTETIDSSPPAQIETYEANTVQIAPQDSPKPVSSKLSEAQAAAIRSRFILGPVTPEEEASWPCTKQEIVEMLKVAKKNAKRGSKGCVRLSEVVAKFGFKSNDVARRCLRHFGWDANPPHTYLTKAKK
jgi:hypothetical protein